MFHKGGEGRPRGFGFGSFAVSQKKPDVQLGQSALPESAPVPVLPVVNKRGYTGLSTITQNALDINYGNLRKRPKTEEEYFEQDEEDHRVGQLAYIPAPGSPTWDEQQRKDSSDASSSDEDPLDAYMANIEKKLQKDNGKHGTKKGKSPVKETKVKEVKGVRDDIENEDDEESYYRYVEENPNAGADKDDSDLELEYDEDGNPIAPVKSKYIDPLPPIDHSTISYKEFTKNFYQEHEEIAALSPEEVDALRATLGVKVTGPLPPKPVTSFAHLGFDEPMLRAIRKAEYTQPSPIQAQGVPVAMSGRDMIGIAKTGSGKTAAFIWPMLTHIMDQRELVEGEGPIGLILAPTRELAQQIYLEAKRFGKVYGVGAICCFGGGSKWEQSKALQEGAEIVVATPGRMIDLIKMKATNLERVTFLVLDEADRMFDMGFEPQVRSICDHVRPDRQTLMFSATFKRKVERLARDVLTDPVKVVQGDVGEANEDVTQIVLVVPSMPPTAKWNWLTGHLVEFTSVALLHGDMDQNDRTKVIASFKKKDFPILVATDVAAAEYLLPRLSKRTRRGACVTRGLDIPHVRTVVNYDIARDTTPTRIASAGLVVLTGLTFVCLAPRAVPKGVLVEVLPYSQSLGQGREVGSFWKQHEATKGASYLHGSRTGVATDVIGYSHVVQGEGCCLHLITDKEKEFAGHLVRNLEGANQAVPQSLMDLAMQAKECFFLSQWFKKSRFKQDKGKRLNVGGHGLGFRTKERPGLGSSNSGPLTVLISEHFGAFAGSLQAFLSSPLVSREQHPVAQAGPMSGLGSYAASVLSAPRFVAASDGNKGGDFKSGAASSSRHGAGPQTDRLTSMRAAFSSQWFKKSRFKQDKGKRLNVGGHGLGFRTKERPGLGSSNSGHPVAQAGPMSGLGSYAASVLSAPRFVAASDGNKGGDFKSGAASSSRHGAGPQTDRLTSMRAAFSSQYKSQFTAATDTAWKLGSQQVSPSPRPGPTPIPPPSHNVSAFCQNPSAFPSPPMPVRQPEAPREDPSSSRQRRRRHAPKHNWDSIHTGTTDRQLQQTNAHSDN
ncbi:hypothetical protein HPB47_022037 [Ixodes persulcatus]|uniref:Uncharacterized protein n=1 Tax=Ixodes persulcatus TaxID=34615 RepID=A0AC60QB64_IXOPE|nr:hypothetical protein HPB47_022037 [Ixodes persulcatus]